MNVPDNDPRNDRWARLRDGWRLDVVGVVVVAVLVVAGLLTLAGVLPWPWWGW